MEPNTPFFVPGGTMEPNAPSYLPRSADEQLFASLMKGEYVFLLDSRQKGKSSMIARTIVQLKEQGVSTVKLDLQRIGANVTAEQWYAGLMVGMGQELGVVDELIAYWDSRKSMGPLARWLGAIADVVLERCPGPIVVFVDEVDFVRALDFSTDEFFAGIRDCFNRRSELSGFERLTFCLVGVATPGQLIRNVDITPFNIGTKIELTDFTLDETARFGQILSLDGRNGANLMKRVHYWVNGHPYLTQLLCSRIAENPAIVSIHDVDRLVKETFFAPEARHTEPNLAAVEQRILDPDVPGLSIEERKTQVLDLYGRLLRGKGVAVAEENPVIASLKLAGVGHQVQGELRVRNRVYQSVFNEGWRQQSLPNAELRRQRGAARLAMLRTAAVAGIVVIAVSSAAIGILRISRDRGKALAMLGQRTQDLSKVSSDRKAALTDLEKRNEDLKRISKEREDALSALGKSNESLSRTADARKRVVDELERQSSALKQRNEEISRVSKEREHALTALGARTRELEMRNYTGIMSSIQLALQKDRFIRVAELVEQSKRSPLRGWEWGHASMLINSHIAEFRLPEGAVLERQPDWSLWYLTSDTIYELTPNGLRFRRKTALPHFKPIWRSGNLRIQQDPSTQKYVFRDAETDRIIFPDPPQGRTLDVDAIQKLTLQQRRDPDGLPIMQLLPLNGGEPLVTFKGLSSFPALARFMVDETILSLHYDGVLVRWDRSGKRLSSQRLSSFVTFGEFNWVTSRDGSLMCFYDNQFRNLEIRRTTDLSLVSTMSGPTIRASACTIFSDRRQLVVGGFDGEVKVFNLDTGQLLRTFTGHTNRVTAAYYPWDGDNRLVSVDSERNLRVWSFDTPPAVSVYRDQERHVGAATLLSSGRFLVSWDHIGIPDRTIISRNLATGAVARRSGWETMDVTNKYVFLALENGTVERLSLDGLKVEKTVQVFDSRGYMVQSFAGGKLLLARRLAPRGLLASREYAILDADSMKVQSRFSLDLPDETSFPNISFDRTGSKVLITVNIKGTQPGLSSGLGFIVSSRDGKLLKTIRMDMPLSSGTLAPDGKHLLLAIGDKGSRLKTPTLIDVETLKTKKSFPPIEASSLSLLIDSTNGLLIGRTVSNDRFLLDFYGPVHLWDVRTRRYISTLAPMSEIHYLDVSPDGGRIVTGGPNQANIVWDSKTGEELFTLQYDPLTKSIQSAGLISDSPSFSADGRRIILACTDGAVRIFNSLPWKDQPKAARK